MIKITSKAFQLGEVVIEIEYDVDREIKSFEVKRDIQQVAGLTWSQVKTWILNQVGNRRTEDLKAKVDALIDPHIDEDLEAP